MKKVHKMGESVTVRNAICTADRVCSNCGTWLNHWLKYSSYNVGDCSILNCHNAAEVGAHVLRPKATAAIKACQYIIPMCRAHNSKASSVYMKTKVGVDFVWANINETCSK